MVTTTKVNSEHCKPYKPLANTDRLNKNTNRTAEEDFKEGAEANKDGVEDVHSNNSMHMR